MDGHASFPAAGRPDASTSRWILGVLAGIIVIGFALRLWGCFGQGLPYTFYKDEENNVQRALKFGAQKNFNPGWFNKPALGYYIWFAEFGAYYFLGRGLGWFESPEDFAVSYFNDPGPFYIIGRVNATIFGTLGILLTYHLGRRIRGPTVGLLAAAALAVTFGQVASCQEVKKDIVATFFTVASALVLLDVIEKGRWRDYLLSGSLAGLGMATKYYSAALIASYAVAHLFRENAAAARSPRVWLSPRAGAGVLAFFLSFFAGSPYNFLSRQYLDEQVLPQLRFILRHLSGGKLGQTVDIEPEGPYRGVVGKSSTVWDSFEHLFEQFFAPYGVGHLLGALAALGLIWTVFRIRCRCRDGPVAALSQDAREGSPRKDGFLLVTAVVFVAIIAIADRQFPEPRHLNIIYPVAAVLAAIAWQESWLLAGRRLAPHAGTGRRWMLVAFGALILLPFPGMPAREIIASNIRHLREDPRLRVLAWIDDNIPAGSGIINDKDWLPLKPTSETCKLVIDRLEEKQRSFRTSLQRAQEHPGDPESAKAIIWLRREIARTETYLTRWFWEKSSVRSAGRPTYTVIPWNHDWYTEKLNERDEASNAYNPTWEHSPWGRLFHEIFREARNKVQVLTGVQAKRRFLELLKVEIQKFVREDLAREGAPADQFPERYAKTAREFDLTDDDVSLVELWRRRSPLSAGWQVVAKNGDGSGGVVPFRWFVSSQVTYNNYDDDPRKPWKRLNFPDWSDFYRDLKAHYDCREFDPRSGEIHEVIRIWDLKERKDEARVIRMW